ncbi:MAG: ribonuclease HII [Flavisolibacter sp.]|nr:ribonuclease HII [Flavisolibacter sp.]
MLLSFFDEDLLEAGCDEAGRGCLAGPVYAAAVILPKNFSHPLLNDSKQLTEEQRYRLRPFIEEKALAYAVADLCNKQIDKINILKASLKSMHLAIKQLHLKPQLLLIDGNRFTPFKKIPHKCIIQGDGLYASIAAASVLAKTYRDDYMKLLHKKCPQYNWLQNKGYATREHQKALEKWGPSKFHRRSFRLDYSQQELCDEIIYQ